MGAATALPVRDIRVEPGTPANAIMLVRNTGQVVDQFTIEMLGDCTPWTSVTPTVVNLLPGADVEVKIDFAPPRDPAVHAGVVPFGIRVTSREDVAGSTVAEGSVEVGAFDDVQVELVPRQSKGSRRGRHQVAIDNRGNQPTAVEVSAIDEEEALDFSFDHRAATIAPGAAAFIRVYAKPEKRFFKGADRQHPFIVTVAPSTSSPVAARGTMTQRQLLPGWLIPAVAALAALAILAVVLYFTLLKPVIKSTADDAAKKAIKSAASSQSKAVKSAAAAAGAAKKDAAAAKKQAAGAQAAASSAAKIVGAGGGGGNSNQATGPSNTPLRSGLATAFSLQADSAPTPSNPASFQIINGPTLQRGQVLVITAVVMQNPNGDLGTLEIRRNTTTLLQEGLANFRDLDHHFDDEPLVFTDTSPLRMAVHCQKTTTTNCSPSVLFTGRLVKTPRPSPTA